MTTQKPAVTVVLVGDYASGDELGWQELRATLDALGEQDFPGPVEVLFVESEALARAIPSDLRGRLANLRVVCSPASSSLELKNAGVEAAQSELVCILDGDCVPEPDWLRHLVEALRGDPALSVVSGLTVYRADNLVARCLGLLSRACVEEPDRRGGYRHISNNNALWRRSAFLAHPLSNAAGPFGAHLQTAAAQRSGLRLGYEPRAGVRHAFESWSMERDIRRQLGYATIRVRDADPSMPYAWLTRGGKAAIPLLVAGRVAVSWRRCLRSYRRFGVGAHQLPLLFGLALVVHALEAPGMRVAFRGQRIGQTQYR